MKQEKMNYQVLRFFHKCLHQDCKNGCVGHETLGIGVEDKRYTRKEADNTLSAWKQVTSVVRAELSLDGTLLRWWERDCARWPETQGENLMNARRNNGQLQ